MTRTVAALFVDPRGCYAGLPGVECWDEARDARLYQGPWPVVAHPPCSRWCRMAPVNQKRYGQTVGEDGGCFSSALCNVRRCGGVLEHPAGSYAWERYGLPVPVRGAWRRGLFDCGYVTEVSQGAYGHRARKATWLYVVGCSLPALDWSDPEPEAWVSWCQNHNGADDKPRLGKREASATPPAFRDLLLRLARSSDGETTKP